MKTLTPQKHRLLTLYFTTLIILWIGATLANIATIFGRSVNLMGLVGISVFIGVMLVRAFVTRNER